MTIYLIKKDLFLVKKYLLLTMFLGLIIPIFFSWRAPTLLGFTVLIMSVLLVEVLLVGNLLTEEEKYPKAEMLLCSTPYTRRELIVEKYVFIFLIYIYCCIAYKGVSLIFTNIFFPNFKTILMILLINTVFWGFFLPLQYRYGIQSTKLLLSIGVFAFPLILTSLKNISSNWIRISMINNLTETIQCVILIILVIIIEIVSFCISDRIYSHKEF